VCELDSTNENLVVNDDESQSANKKIKDGVFKLLFEVPENAAELYSALKDEKCSPEDVQIFTLTTAISGKLKNDLAIVVKDRALVLGEHMSSPYANMPIRFLMYLGQLYQKWIKVRGEGKFIYSSTLYKIPTPEFVVFYNGTIKKPEKEILKLSDAFMSKGDKKLGSINLKVPVYNINKGMNKELFKKSPNLKQYAEFIAKVREFSDLYEDYTRAVREAANYCIANDILADFLKKQGGSIVSILTAEFDIDVARSVWQEEAREEGREVGREEGREVGREEGREEGIEVGREEGKEEEKTETAISMLKDGMDVEIVVKYSRLSREKVLALKATLEIA